MNITDIFYYNGEFNWDSINTISNFILVTGLVLITWWYAREVKRQTDLMVIDRKRNKILEEVQNVLTPAINQLEQEINAIQQKKVFWHRYTSGECGFNQGLSLIFYNKKYEASRSLFDGKRSGALNDVIGKFPEFHEMFVSHDSLFGELSDLFTAIEKNINPTIIKERLEKLVKEFNESKDDAHKFIRDIHLFVEYIINLEYTIDRIPDSIQPNIDFWEENHEELLKLRNSQIIDEISIRICNKLVELRELNDITLNFLDEIREKYRNEYNFTDNEIDPFRDGWY